MVQCSAYTRRGVRCRNHILRSGESKYCKVHQHYEEKVSKEPKVSVESKVDKVPSPSTPKKEEMPSEGPGEKQDLLFYNTECPICMEDSEEESRFLLFSCKHRIHEECLKGMIQPQCPFCRQDIAKELPEEVKKLVETTMERERTERELREREDIPSGIPMDSFRNPEDLLRRQEEELLVLVRIRAFLRRQREEGFYVLLS